MFKTTTKASLLNRELTPVEQQMSDYYDNVCSLPESMKGTMPFHHNTKAVVKLYDDWLGKLFGKVAVDYTTIEGKHYYRFTLSVLNRKHSFVLVPFSAYMKAQMIITLQRAGIYEHIVSEDNTSTIYIPTWARRAVYEECRAICKEHQAEVDGHVSMMETFAKDTDSTDAKPVMH